MRVTTSGAVDIAVLRETVWAALHDAESIAPCVPGCSAVVPQGDGRFTVTARVRLGPVRLGFDGIVQIADFEKPRRLVLTGCGAAGRAGGANGTVAITLSERGDGTCRMAYSIAAEADGPIAKLGSTVLDGIATTLAGLFVRKFAASLELRARGAARIARSRPSMSRTA